MALVSCPECQKEVSTQALACPQCAFPFPGKRANAGDKVGSNLLACPDCRCPVSKNAQSCPHCGVSLKGEQASRTRNGNLAEETWLCTHCGTPYTRKIQRGVEDASPSHQGLLANVEASPQPELAEMLTPAVSHSPVSETVSTIRHRRSPLWQDPAIPQEVDFSPPQHSRKNKKSIVLAILSLVFLLIALGFGVLWGVNGITPIELFHELSLRLSSL